MGHKDALQKNGGVYCYPTNNVDDDDDDEDHRRRVVREFYLERVRAEMLFFSFTFFFFFFVFRVLSPFDVFSRFGRE